MRRLMLLPVLAALVAAGPPPPSSPPSLSPPSSPPSSPPPPGAEACMGCHVKGGGVGLLLGRPAPDTVRMMEGYRSGQMPATLMNRIVKGYNPDEVIQLALWFAAQ